MSTLPFDITAGRHGGNEESRQQNLFLHTHKAAVRERIRVFVGACGWNGATLLEMAAAMDHPTEKSADGWARKYYPNEISGRITEMKKMGEDNFDRATMKPRANADEAALQQALYDSGRRRGGCAVLVTNPRHIGPAVNE